MTAVTRQARRTEGTKRGHADVRHRGGDTLRLLEDETDLLGVEEFATHQLTSDDAPEAYATFLEEDEMVEVVVTT